LRSYLKSALLISCLFLTACGGGGGGGGGDTNPGTPPPTTSVSGTVTYNGAPLAGVTVVAYDTNNNKDFGTTTTDVSGNYSFAGLDASCDCIQVYNFIAFKPGYSFSAMLAGNPTGNRANLTWSGPAGYGWNTSSGAATTMAGYNGVFAGLNTTNAPIIFNVITFTSVAGGSVATADFTGYNGSNPFTRPIATGQTQSYAAGDDGATQNGVAAPGPRFVDNGDGTITDTVTGLVWLKNAACFSAVNWPGALGDVNQLASGQCGLNDGSAVGQWRLPNVVELESLIDAAASNPAVSGPFTNISTGIYWTSTAYWGGEEGTTNAWAIRMADGRYINDNGVSSSNVMATSLNNVWAVRGVSSGLVSLPASGAVQPFVAGDDGTLAMGIPLPTFRMVDNGNGTVTDTVTGLIWLKMANCIQDTWTGALSSIALLANGQCGLSDGSSAGQWRMPNRNEMESLQDRGQNNHGQYFDATFTSITAGIPSQSPIFSTMIELQFYWTSTTDAASTTEAWTVFSCDFGVYDTLKSTASYSLAVR